MKKRYIVLIPAVLLLLFLAACGQCKTAEDCEPRSGHEAGCVDKECKYRPIPGVCGNGECESFEAENECSCPQDCGSCSGSVPGSKYLSKQCNKERTTCLVVVTGKSEPKYESKDLKGAGDIFKIETLYSQPFNLKRDTFGVKIILTGQGSKNSDEKITNIELTATTKDRRTITLALQPVDKQIYSGSSITEDLILDFPTKEVEGQLSNLNLKINFDYSIKSAGKKIPRQSAMQTKYRDTFIFVIPAQEYKCPESCDDGNSGTRDFCNVETNYFCKHEQIAGACGNFKCDSNENSCTCEQDCGKCIGSAGVFLEYKCKRRECVEVLKPGVKPEQKSLFDDRSIGPAQLDNVYTYNSPFNINEDVFKLDFRVYRKDPTVSSITIDRVRLLSGQEFIAETDVNQEISESTTTANLNIPTLGLPEQEKTLSLVIYYRYVEDGDEKGSEFKKVLGKVVLLNPQ